MAWVISTVILLAVVSILAYKYYSLKRIYKQSEEGRLKLKEFYIMLLVWIQLFQHERSVKEFFDKYRYKKIAIYGMKEMGDILYKELKRVGVDVAYIIDKNAESIKMDLPVVLTDDNVMPVDAVIVTAVHYYPQIAENMSEKISCPIISLEDIIFSLYEYDFESVV